MKNFKSWYVLTLATLILNLAGHTSAQINTHGSPQDLAAEYCFYNEPILGVITNPISISETSQHTGMVATVEGTVVDTAYIEHGSMITYLNFGAPYPSQVFSVNIPPHVREEFTHKPEIHLHGMRMQVTGYIKNWNNRVTMAIKKPSQIKVLERDPSVTPKVVKEHPVTFFHQKGRPPAKVDSIKIKEGKVNVKTVSPTEWTLLAGSTNLLSDPFKPVMISHSKSMTASPENNMAFYRAHHTQATGPENKALVSALKSYMKGGNIDSNYVFDFELSTVETLRLGDSMVSDLAPLKYAINLKTLDLSQNTIQDLTALKDLTKLERLHLSRNQITNLSPLENLTRLEVLHLSDNSIIDLSPIINLTNLMYFFIENNQVEDLSPLAKMRRLRVLGVDNNPLKNINTLKRLKDLEYLGIRNCGINSLECIRGLKKITVLYSSGNKFSKQYAEEFYITKKHQAIWNMLSENPANMPKYKKLLHKYRLIPNIPLKDLKNNFPNYDWSSVKDEY